jgi:hypothetical protein
VWSKKKIQHKKMDAKKIKARVFFFWIIEENHIYKLRKVNSGHLKKSETLKNKKTEKKLRIKKKELCRVKKFKNINSEKKYYFVG